VLCHAEGGKFLSYLISIGDHCRPGLRVERITFLCGLYLNRWNFDNGRPASHFDEFFVALLTVFQVIIVIYEHVTTRRKKHNCFFIFLFSFITLTYVTLRRAVNVTFTWSQLN